jgi:hypothetical protein
MLGEKQEDRMRVFKHKSNKGRIAVTGDADGKALPGNGETWSCIGETEVRPGAPHIGRSGDEILADIRRDGFSVI